MWLLLGIHGGGCSSLGHAAISMVVQAFAMVDAPWVFASAATQLVAHEVMAAAARHAFAAVAAPWAVVVMAA